MLPLIDVLSSVVVPATVRLSDNVTASVTSNIPLIDVLSSVVVPATVRLSDNIANPATFRLVVFAESETVILS